MKKLHYSLSILIIVSTLLFMLNLPVHGQSLGIPEDVHYILIDSKTGLVIAEQNADNKIKPASLTKILTGIVALENSNDLQQEMTVSQAAVNDIGRGGMNIGIMAGEAGLTLENMLNVMLIKSANETANIIAENLAASRSEYMSMMNIRAKELGALNTYFVNPSGKDTEKEDGDHITTARDMALFSRHAMTLPEFRKIVATEYYYGMPTSTNKHAEGWDPLVLRNTNKFLWYDNTYTYSVNGEDHEYTVIGMKTGYTGAAGNNLVIAATDNDGMELICVVMHVMQPNKVYGYATQLLDYGFENYSLQKVTKAGDTIKTIVVDGTAGSDNILNLVAETDFSAALPRSSGDDIIESIIQINSTIQAPISKGAVLGYIEYKSGNAILGRVNIISSKQIFEAVENASGHAISTAEDGQDYSYALLGVLLALCSFVIIRSILKRISRKIKAKRCDSQY